MDGCVRHSSLYGAYARLPTPPALHVHARHFEDFMASFVSGQGLQRSMIGDLLERISNGVRKVGLELSTKEMNSLMYLKNYDESNILTIKRQWYEFASEETSTCNIFLKYASTHRNYAFVKDILNHMTDRGVKMDRMSYDIVLGFLGKMGLEDDARDMLKGVLTDGIVLDISLLNTVQGILVDTDVEMAEKIAALLVAKADLSPQWGAHKRRHYTHQLQYLDTLSLQTLGATLFIPSPTFETFAPLLHHYASLRQLVPGKVIGLLTQMQHCNIAVPLTMAKSLVNCLKNHPGVERAQLCQILSLIEQNTIRLDRTLMKSLVSLIQHPSYDRDAVLDLEKGWARARSPEVDVAGLSRDMLLRMAAA